MCENVDVSFATPTVAVSLCQLWLSVVVRAVAVASASGSGVSSWPVPWCS